jgi:NhaC family Na+:H+ antiporter
MKKIVIVSKGIETCTCIWEQLTELIGDELDVEMMCLDEWHIRSFKNTLVLITFCSFAFAGTITKAGCLDVILEKILSSVKSVGGLVASTSLSCVTMAIVTGSSYLSILIPGELFKDAYKKRGLAAKNLSRTLEDSGTVIVPLVPWSMAGVYMSSTLGVPVIQYAPWAFLCYLGFIFAIIYGFTGFGIAKIEESKPEVSKSDSIKM